MEKRMKKILIVIILLIVIFIGYKILELGMKYTFLYDENKLEESCNELIKRLEVKGE